MPASLKGRFVYLLRPLSILRAYPTSRLRPDLLAGLTVAVISLPQAVAYGLVAGLTPAMGLYTAIVAPIAAALWGSSNQVQTSPTTVVSLLVFSSLAAVAAPGSANFIVAAGLTAVMAGVFQLIMGLARLGMLVNFISDSLIVGFAAGAGILMAANEFRYLLGVDFSSHTLVETVENLWSHLPQAHVPTLTLGLAALVIMLVVRRLRPRWPAIVISLLAVSVALFVLRLDQSGVKVIGALPRTLPPLTSLPLANLSLAAELLPSALAIAAVGLIQTMAIARNMAVQTGQVLDNNQELVGQGIGNIACGLFSGYPASGSLSCSAINFEAGARTPAASAFSGIFTLVGMLALAPLGAYLPRAALSGILIVIGYGMIDRRQMLHIWRSSRGDAAIMLVTFVSTLFLRIDFAVLAGILMSLAYYILQTSTPRVHPVVPDANFRHLVYEPKRAQCPQLAILDILGDLYFGATSHVDGAIRDHRRAHPSQRFLLLRMHSVQHCDITGIRMLQGIVRFYREQGGDVFMVRVRDSVLRRMKSTRFFDYLGADHFLSEDSAIEHLFYKVLDPAICIYESDVRVFRECQNLPRTASAIDIPLHPDWRAAAVTEVAPSELWQRLRTPSAPLVIDVREPREFQQGHIPQAQSIPLSALLSRPLGLPRDRALVFVCRMGRRSLRAAQVCRQNGYENAAILRGGMLAWEAARLLEAVG